MPKSPYYYYNSLKQRHARAKSARAAAVMTESAPDNIQAGTVVNVKSIMNDAVEPYVFIIHTGLNNPNMEKIEKWEDGQMNFIVNPHTDSASELFHIKELFATNREDNVRVSRYLPKHVGKPVQVKVNVESNKLEIIKDALYIREITILYKHDYYRFPINEYLYPHNPLLHNSTNMKLGCPPYVISREGKGTLLFQETDPAVLAARLEELRQRRKMLDWGANDGELILPTLTKEADYDKLPRFLKFKNARQKAFQLNLKRGHNMMKWTVIENKIATYFGKDKPEHLETLEDFQKLFIEQAEDHEYDRGLVYPVLQIMKYWQDDEEFTRQEMNGINPMRIRKIASLPGTWSTMPPMPAYVMGEGIQLEAELAAGKIYMIDTDMLEVVGDGGKLMPILTGFELPMIIALSDCLFYLDKEDKVRPIAIRIEYKNGGAPSTFWFPPNVGCPDNTHEHLSWLLAKIYFKSANIQYHAILTHFVKSHAVPEVFAIGVIRCLPRQHPLYKLLVPHISGVIPINVQGREFLTKTTGVMAIMMAAGDNLWHLAEAYMKQFKYEHLNLPLDIEARGTADLPGYHFQSDAMAWWAAIYEYCRDFVSLHYKTDAMVEGDSELQNLTKEIRNIGFKRIPENANFPETLTTIPDLIQYTTIILWNSSVRHTAVNFAQFNFLGFIPNAPCAMTRAPPAQDQKVTMEDIMLSLPVKEMARVQIDISYSLSLFSPVEKFFLGSQADGSKDLTTETSIVDEDGLECIAALIRKLKNLKKVIDVRNAKLKIPYDIIRPDKCPLTVQT